MSTSLTKEMLGDLGAAGIQTDGLLKPDPAASQGHTQIVRSNCRMCHGGCGVLVHLRDGKVVKIVGDPDSPLSNGYTCSKGRATVEYLYHPDRLTFPLQRVGARGENRWERIGWDQALETIAERLLHYKAEYGPESVGVAVGTGRPYMFFALRFANAFGTPNFVSYSHNCYLPRIMASMITCRGPLPICDFYGFGGVQPKCVLVWGCNIAETGSADGMCGVQVPLAQRAGAKMIVVDPRRTKTAAKADVWAQVRPGTDVALALGMLHVIVEEGLYDKEFVQQYTVGFERLVERVRQYPPDRVAEITWVPASTIVDMARLYATTKPACLLWGNGVDQSVNCFQTARALMILRGITGNIDVPGGDVFWEPPDGLFRSEPFLALENTLFDRVPPEVRARALGVEGQIPLNPGVRHAGFWDAALSGKPYPVKALVLVGTNPLLTGTDPLRGEAALKSLDFSVAIDLFMNPTAQLADIVLPAATWLEQDDVADMHFIWCVTARRKLVTIGECRDDKDIFIDLAKRMGMAEEFPWADSRGFCEFVLKDAGLTFEQFVEKGLLQGEMRYRKHETEGFPTPAGKFEIASSILEAFGHDALPDFIEPPESPYSVPEIAEEYPLIAITGCKIEPFFHSEHRQLASQRRKNPDPLVDIHPATAAALGVADGDWVWIESRRGRVRQRARVTPDIDPRVVSLQHAWWFPEREAPEYGWKESSANLLLDPTPADSIWGSESRKGFLCKVYAEQRTH
jgi:anaerobic selenocysteine-containing dehydrogenase